MKKLILVLPALLLFTSFLSAQSAQPNYKVVFDITSKDTLDHKNVIRWVNEISKGDPDAKMEVVFYGQSLDLVVKDKSIMPGIISSLAGNKKVCFKVCEVAMKNHNIDKSQLIAGVETVPDGIYEIITKQRQGWGYIKASH
ncbi:MAG: hypothetical protein JWN76_995 [Chitinophagaceae bacterium]|nr:hypothetical protein [Chitinophagaceae bacterium]